MTELIAFLTTGKGTWGHVARLLNEPWDSIVLLTNDYGKDNFKFEQKKIDLVVVNENVGIKDLRDDIKQKLQQRIKSAEVAVNFVSGSGKEHMALISALLQLGVGIRFVALTKDGMEEI